MRGGEGQIVGSITDYGKDLNIPLKLLGSHSRGFIQERDSVKSHCVL